MTKELAQDIETLFHKSLQAFRDGSYESGVNLMVERTAKVQAMVESGERIETDVIKKMLANTLALQQEIQRHTEKTTGSMKNYLQNAKASKAYKISQVSAQSLYRKDD